MGIIDAIYASSDHCGLHLTAQLQNREHDKQIRPGSRCISDNRRRSAIEHPSSYLGPWSVSLPDGYEANASSLAALVMQRLALQRSDPSGDRVRSGYRIQGRSHYVRW